MQELVEYLELLEELKKRQQHASQAYDPMDKQLAFHKCPAWCRLLFGGNRSGKSRSAAQEVYYYFSNKHPYFKTPKAPRIWVLSAEYRTIFEGIWAHLKNVLPPWEIEKWGSKLPNWDIPSYVLSKSGARIDFISAQGGEETRKRLQAAEIDLLVIDEEIGGELWLELQARLITRGGRVTISATLIESEDWLLDLEEQAQQSDETGEVRLFRLNSRDNKYNNEAAMKRFIGNLTAEEFDIRILGKSKKLSGLVYANWTPLHEIEPFPILPHMTKVMCLDPGFRTAAALWVAIDDHQDAYAYREMYLHSTNIKEIVEFIRKSEKDEEINFRYIDPAAFRHHADGTPGIGHRLSEDYDLHFIPANSSNKETNIEDVRRWLLPTLKGTPQFRIFNTLSNFKYERRKYRFQKDKGHRDRGEAKDAPIKRFDHLMNCLEYLATARIQYQPIETEKELIELIATQKEEEIVWPDKPPEEQRNFRNLVRKERLKLSRSDYGSD